METIVYWSYMGIMEKKMETAIGASGNAWSMRVFVMLGHLEF